MRGVARVWIECDSRLTQKCCKSVIKKKKRNLVELNVYKMIWGWSEMSQSAQKYFPLIENVHFNRAIWNIKLKLFHEFRCENFFCFVCWIHNHVIYKIQMIIIIYTYIYTMFIYCNFIHNVTLEVFVEILLKNKFRHTRE